MKKIIIAIDGFSSCGKSTLAKSLANELGYIYIDSGAMYRAVALYCIRKGIINGEFKEEDLTKALDEIEVSFSYNNELNKAETILNGENVEKEIRGVEVSDKVSKIAKVKKVREKMVHFQRQIGQSKGVVMDGRDIGSVVFPEAELKIYMTANPEVRAKRRHEEMLSKGVEVSYEDVYANIVKRDEADTQRQENPLVQTSDAIVLDNTHVTQKEQFQVALTLAKSRISKV